MSVIIPFSQACERNKDPILAVLAPLLDKVHSVLEIGSGTGQHAVYFANACPEIHWQATDQIEYLPGLKAQFSTAETTNLNPPVELDVRQQPWLRSSQQFELIYSANTLHIMAWPVVEAFFSGLRAVSTADARLFIYGPFKFHGDFTSLSNAEFDRSLRARGVGSAIRDFEAVDQLARAAGWRFAARHDLPANNHCLIWQRKDNPQST